MSAVIVFFVSWHKTFDDDDDYVNIYVFLCGEYDCLAEW